MKILALADRKISEDLPALIKIHNIQLVLLLGDLKYNEICDLEEVEVPILGVLGNHCSFNYLENLQAKNLHLNPVTCLSYSFLGYQGCPYYKGGEYESSQEKCSKELETQGKCDILISHSPAEGINSSISPHEGFIGLRDYLDNFSPLLFFHGHSYPTLEQKISRYKNTTVVFVSGLEIFDINELLEIKNLPEAKTY